MPEVDQPSFYEWRAQGFRLGVCGQKVAADLLAMSNFQGHLEGALWLVSPWRKSCGEHPLAVQHLLVAKQPSRHIGLVPDSTEVFRLNTLRGRLRQDRVQGSPLKHHRRRGDASSGSEYVSCLPA